MTPHQTRHHAPRRNAGFTLVEMLVVVSILVISIGIAIPALSVMQEGASTSVGVNAVQIAAATARGYSNRTDREFLSPLIPATVEPEQGEYSGYAALFTPANEIRIVENYEGARRGNGDPLERLDHTGALQQAPTNVGPVPRHLNGFLDGPIAEGAIEYITLPSDAGVAGIIRVNSGGVPMLLAPPFAIWFDANGQLVTGDAANSADRCIYYDGNYNGVYDITDNRLGGYNPDPYDPTSSSFDQLNAVSSTGRYVVPLEQIEAVVGVWIYEKRAFNSAGLGWAGGATNQQRWDWLVENGELVMFSVQAGTPMRSSIE